MIKSYGIIGLGWLGEPLADFLLKKKQTVWGTTTKELPVKQLALKGLKHESFKATGKIIIPPSTIFQTDILIISIPPSKVPAGNYPIIIEQLISALNKERDPLIIFLSSSSVYGNLPKMVKENTPCMPKRANAKLLLQAERVITTSGFRSIILRLAGLVGPGRHPGNFLANKKEVKGANWPVNLVHRDDCIQVIHRFSTDPKADGIYNLVSDQHPPKSTFYLSASNKLGMPPPIFDPHDLSIGKTVSNEKLKKYLDYQFIYPDPFDMI